MRVCSQGDGTFEMNAGEVVSYLTGVRFLANTSVIYMRNTIMSSF